MTGVQTCALPILSTLPKPRPYGDGGYSKQQHGLSQHGGGPLHGGAQLRCSPSGLQGPGGEGGMGENSRHSRELPFPLSEVSHLHFEPPPSASRPTQSSDDEEEWACPHPISPPRTLGVPNVASPNAMRGGGPASCSAFPIPQRPNTLSCHPPGYLPAEHAQSWPSTTEEADPARFQDRKSVV